MDLRDQIISHLKKKGNYSPDVDDYLIDMLIDNIGMYHSLLKDIKEEGLITKGKNGNGFVIKMVNPSFNLYQSCLKNIHQCASKLGINRRDRLMLKLIEEKIADKFDVDFA